jgi:hypothetical protein
LGDGKGGGDSDPPTDATGIPVGKKTCWPWCCVMVGRSKKWSNVRDRVRVGLEARLNDVGLTDDMPKVIGTPSRIPFSSRPSRFGRGKGRFDSGPARFWRTS